MQSKTIERSVLLFESDDMGAPTVSVYCSGDDKSRAEVMIATSPSPEILGPYILFKVMINVLTSIDYSCMP